MTNLGPSLEDLLPSNQPKNSDDSPSAALDEKMKAIAIKEKEGETARQAANVGLPYVDLFGFSISPDTINTIPREEAHTLSAVCFLNNGSELRLGTIDYNDNVKKLEANLKEKWHANVETYLISPHSLEHALKIYDNLPKLRKFVAGVEITADELSTFRREIKNFHDLDTQAQKTSISELITLIIAGAIESRSSDIHIEAQEKDIKVRYRIDGVLNDVSVLNHDTWRQLASRIKGLAKLKINVTDKPQDGRFSIYLTDDRVDVRVSALPTAFGESIVIRLLMSSAAQLSFEDLGLRGQAGKILQREIERPNGMIITTGPTGSGKTTTLYAILKKLNSPDTKIITIEDPIEYELKGVNQSQINDEYTFAKGLRSIVRQDPDIIMVGEIRDLDTAEIAIQAALTGHLVLSTIHTNDAFGTIPRFLSMGAKSFLLAPAVNVAIGQRLVRIICKDCKQETTPDTEMLERAKALLAEIPENSGEKPDLTKMTFYRGAGCPVCQGLGYKGRIGIYEVLPIDDEIEKLILSENVSEYDVKEVAKKHGIVTMVQDGLLKALDGITTVEEVFRVAE